MRQSAKVHESGRNQSGGRKGTTVQEKRIRARETEDWRALATLAETRTAGAETETTSEPWVIVLAGGEGRRLQEYTTTPDGKSVPKQFCHFRDQRTLLGATVDRAPELLHGKTSSVFHTNAGVLQGLPDPFTATRYHSLTILPESVPAELQITARTRSGVIMAVRHTELPIHGVQFHPESILPEGGHRMLANWLADCGWVRDDTLIRRLENEVRAAVRPYTQIDPATTDRTSA